MGRKGRRLKPGGKIWCLKRVLRSANAIPGFIRACLTPRPLWPKASIQRSRVWPKAGIQRSRVWSKAGYGRTPVSPGEIQRSRVWPKAGIQRSRGSLVPSMQSPVVREYGGQFVDLLQRAAGAAYHAGQGIVGDNDGEPGFFHQQPVDIPQERTSAGEYHALFRYVRTEFRRRLFERRFDGADDAVERIGQRFQDFIAGNGETARNAFGQ